MSTTDLTLMTPDYLARLTALAEQMATATVTIPQHLQRKPGDCLAVVMQAAQWKMNPFAVAQKSFHVGGVLGYEAQLINAVINRHAPIKGRLAIEWSGDWEKILGHVRERQTAKGAIIQEAAWHSNDEIGLSVTISATLEGEKKARILKLLLVQATTRNSTLWASDPKQQLAYLAIKKWARLYCPDVILGIYSRDELDNKVVEGSATVMDNRHASNPISMVKQALASEPQLPPESEKNAALENVLETLLNQIENCRDRTTMRAVSQKIEGVFHTLPVKAQQQVREAWLLQKEVIAGV